jgi:ABC-type branched-subunit amino acid transport system permease subunit
MTAKEAAAKDGAAKPGARARVGFRQRVRRWSRDQDIVVYTVLLVGAVLWPPVTEAIVGNDTLVGLAGFAGVWVLLALGLNVVVGFAGLLDLGYAAFFAIGAYCYALFASQQLGNSPIHHAFHIPFWPMLLVGMFVAATAGALLGAPTLRLRGDYLAIVTLGFGEIVPRLFRNLPDWTAGVNAISGIDAPSLPVCLTGPWSGYDLAVKYGGDCQFTSSDPIPWYLLIVGLIIIAVILLTNLQRSRLGRAWMAVREDEVAAAAMGINTRNIKLLAFAIGAATSGFGGAYYGAKLSLVSPQNFDFIVSITVLVMVVAGGMGNIPGVLVGALVMYYINFIFLHDLPGNVVNVFHAVGITSLDAKAGDWPGLNEFVSRLNFLVLGLVLVLMMLLRPQGFLPSRVRQEELRHAAAQGSIFDARAGQT